MQIRRQLCAMANALATDPPMVVCPDKEEGGRRRPVAVAAHASEQGTTTLLRGDFFITK